MATGGYVFLGVIAWPVGEISMGANMNWGPDMVDIEIRWGFINQLPKLIVRLSSTGFRLVPIIPWTPFIPFSPIPGLGMFSTIAGAWPTICWKPKSLVENEQGQVPTKLSRSQKVLTYISSFQMSMERGVEGYAYLSRHGPRQ